MRRCMTTTCASSPPKTAADVLALGQGAFFLVAGAWPLVHLRSFEAVTGPKADDWLVRTVGSLLTVVGGVLVSAGRRRRVTREIRALAMGSAGALAAIDVIYVAKGRMSRVYLLDAAVQLGIVASWAIARQRHRHRAREAAPSRPIERTTARLQSAFSHTPAIGSRWGKASASASTPS